MLHRAYESHHVGVHTTWASAWTGVLLVLAAVVGGDPPRLWWLLVVPVLMGMFHLLFRVGRWADRRGASNALSRRATRAAWGLPVAVPVFVVLEALTG